MSKVYKIVQEKIISQLEEAIENGGTAPWRKPWKDGMPKNYLTKKPYRGINLMMLQGGSYLTFKQIQILKKKNSSIKLKKGSKSEIVVFWSFPTIEDDDGEERKAPIFKYYRVFSIADVEGIEEDVSTFANDPIEDAEKIVEGYKEECRIKIQTSSRAFYRPGTDEIVSPELNQFENPTEYYSTLFHEMVHSTGHSSRLNRFTGDSSETQFGSDSYSKEELVAEIGSNMLIYMLNIEDTMQQENSISYLHGWLSRIKEDTKFIVTASQQAQKACDYILSFSNEMEITDDEAV